MQDAQAPSAVMSEIATAATGVVSTMRPSAIGAAIDSAGLAGAVTGPVATDAVLMRGRETYIGMEGCVAWNMRDLGSVVYVHQHPPDEALCRPFAG